MMSTSCLDRAPLRFAPQIPVLDSSGSLRSQPNGRCGPSVLCLLLPTQPTTPPLPTPPSLQEQSDQISYQGVLKGQAPKICHQGVLLKKTTQIGNQKALLDLSTQIGLQVVHSG